MVHPMYGIDAYLTKYPLVEKAIEKTATPLEGCLFWMLGEMGMIALPRTIIETVEKTIPGTDAEKQAIIIAALYSFVIDFMRPEQASFAADYDAETAALLNQIADQNPTGVRPTPAARAGLVGVIAFLSLQGEMLKGMTKANALPAAEIEKIDKAMAESAKLFCNANAPLLEDLYAQTQKNYLTALAGPVKAVKTQKKPRPPSPQ